MEQKSHTKKWIGTPHLISIPELIYRGCTRMEAVTLSQLLRGLSNKEIAESLNLSEKGVKFHVTNLLRKFEANSRSQLIVKFYDMAFGSLPVGTRKTPQR